MIRVSDWHTYAQPPGATIRARRRLTAGKANVSFSHVGASRKKKRKTYHHGNLKEALVEEALALIQDRGPEGFTLTELAARLGVTHTAPYRHFPTKEALLSAVAAAGFAELRARIEAALGQTEPASRARFFAGAYAYVRFAVDRPAHFRAMYFGPKPDPETPELLERKMAAFGLLIDYLREAQAKGTIGPGDPRAIALPVWAMHHGLASLACNGPLSDLPEAELRAMVEEAHAALLDGIVSGVSAPDRLPDARVPPPTPPPTARESETARGGRSARARSRPPRGASRRGRRRGSCANGRRRRA